MTSEMERTAIVAPNAPGGRSYSQAVGVGDLVFVAGTAGKNMETGLLRSGWVLALIGRIATSNARHVRKFAPRPGLQAW